MKTNFKHPDSLPQKLNITTANHTEASTEDNNNKRLQNKSEILDNKIMPRNSYSQVKKTMNKIHSSNQEWILSGQNSPGLINKQNEIILRQRSRSMNKDNDIDKKAEIYNMNIIAAPTALSNNTNSHRNEDKPSNRLKRKNSSNQQTTNRNEKHSFEYYLENGSFVLNPHEQIDFPDFKLQRNLEYSNRYKKEQEMTLSRNEHCNEYGMSPLKYNYNNGYCMQKSSKKERADEYSKSMTQCRNTSSNGGGEQLHSRLKNADKISGISPNDIKISGNKPSEGPFIMRDLRGNLLGDC